MSTPEFDAIERDAVKAAGRAGYAYLDSIEKDNVFDLGKDQALRFFKCVIDGFGDHMRARLLAPRDRSGANG